jgi:hypothetical protein
MQVESEFNAAAPAANGGGVTDHINKPQTKIEIIFNSLTTAPAAP